MKAVSLFSGCGGSDLGAKSAGAHVIFANDISSLAVDTYRRHKALIASDSTEVRHGDVRSIKSFPRCDLLLGCYPCQSFTMGGPRSPADDPKSVLYFEFLRALRQTRPKYFVVENVAGMQWLEAGRYVREQIEAFRGAGEGYHVSVKLLNAKDYGVPADRKRVFLVGTRRDLGVYYWFPAPTHGPKSATGQPFASHGDAIADLGLDAEGQFYAGHPPEEVWWYMSRNRKRPWSGPAFTIVGNWRHVSLHPASPTMRLVSSNLDDGSKQVWEFTGDYDHLDGHPERGRLQEPRRLSWQECAALQTLPRGLEPSGSVREKFRQIGNAVPPKLMEAIICAITGRQGLKSEPSPDQVEPLGLCA